MVRHHGWVSISHWANEQGKKNKLGAAKDETQPREPTMWRDQDHCSLVTWRGLTEMWCDQDHWSLLTPRPNSLAKRRDHYSLKWEIFLLETPVLEKAAACYSLSPGYKLDYEMCGVSRQKEIPRHTLRSDPSSSTTKKRIKRIMWTHDNLITWPEIDSSKYATKEGSNWESHQYFNTIYKFRMTSLTVIILFQQHFAENKFLASKKPMYTRATGIGRCIQWQ